MHIYNAVYRWWQFLFCNKSAILYYIIWHISTWSTVLYWQCDRRYNSYDPTSIASVSQYCSDFLVCDCFVKLPTLLLLHKTHGLFNDFRLLLIFIRCVWIYRIHAVMCLIIYSVKQLVDKLMLFLAFIILQMKRVRICYIKYTLCLILITALICHMELL